MVSPQMVVQHSLNPACLQILKQEHLPTFLLPVTLLVPRKVKLLFQGFFPGFHGEDGVCLISLGIGVFVPGKNPGGGHG